MTVQQCYAAFGGDYDDASRRLMKDERIAKYLRMYLNDDSYSLLLSSVAACDWETAFRAAHTMKGNSLNLALSPITRYSIAVTEALRPGHAPADRGLFDADLAALGDAYRTVTDTIRLLD